MASNKKFQDNLKRNQINHRIFNTREQRKCINHQNEQIFNRLQEIHRVSKLTLYKRFVQKKHRFTSKTPRGVNSDFSPINAPVEGSMHVQYRKRVAAQIDAENMALAERILNQRGRQEISSQTNGMVGVFQALQSVFFIQKNANDLFTSRWWRWAEGGR